MDDTKTEISIANHPLQVHQPKINGTSHIQDVHQYILYASNQCVNRL